MAKSKGGSSVDKTAAELSPADYVHLHNHTQYSLLDGLTKVPALLDYVKESGMTAAAITDHGTMSGVIEFYKEAKARAIKPIIGMETYVAARKHTQRDPGHDKPNFHLILLAMNEVGYRNLMRLSTIANLEGFYYKPRIDHELLEQYSQGLIALSGCASGELGELLKADQYDQAKTVAQWYKQLFGDRYYLEIQDHGHVDHPSVWDGQTKLNTSLFKLAEELNIPCVLTCDAHYLKHADQEAHEVLLCVQTAAYLSDNNRMSLSEFELHVTDPRDVIKRWGKSHPEIIRNTKRVADRCDLTIELGKILIPKFPVPKGETEKSFLHTLVYRGLAWRYGDAGEQQAESMTIKEAQKHTPKNILDRAEYELGVIDRMGYNGYILIVQDFINWGKDRGIIFGPGRGSAAGSIVSYAVRITEVDPMRYQLMFERFLNPNRISMPDIDIDMQDTRRDEVIQYCVEKYGSDSVANIVTFGKMAARNAVRDVARVLQVPYAEADRLAKMITPPVQGRHIPLATSLKNDADLANEYKTNPTAERVFNLAMQLEGTIRSHGVHAAGVVIAPADIVTFVPLEMAQKGVVATQYSMGPVEELGLLKMDFLGLSNLTIINNALRIIKKVYDRVIDLTDIPTDDPKTFELLQHADTTGVFQLESAGMKRYLKELKPTLFEDIIAMVALYRPGPMAEIPRFIEGKNHPETIKFLHPSLEPVLGDTYGVMVTQEQIIQLLQLVAGYSAGEADLVRKAIGKKKRDIMQAEEPKFIAGCVTKGLTEVQAHELWAQIQPFADYSFNKAHATCYAQIAYWTAYLKANYPAAFMAALMTSDYDNTDRLAIEIAECKKMGLDVLLPDVNESFLEFAVVPGEKPAIRFGMGAVKNVGTGAVEEIIRARDAGGHFADIADFLSRVDVRIVNRKALESLIKAGAFDRFADRSTLLHNLDVIVAYGSKLAKQALSGQTDLFGNLLDETHHAKPMISLQAAPTQFNSRDQLLWERELLGLYLSEHPLAAFSTLLQDETVPLNSLETSHDGQNVTVGGTITTVREITTKNGQKMAFVKIEDEFGEVEVIVFPSALQQTAGLWQRDKVVIVTGKVNARGRDGQAGDEVKVMANTAREITHEQAVAHQSTGKKPTLPKAHKSAATTASTPLPTIQQQAKVYIRLSDSDNQGLLLSLKQAIDERPGDSEVVLVLGDDQAKQIVRLPTRIKSDDSSLERLALLVGAENVALG